MNAKCTKRILAALVALVALLLLTSGCETTQSVIDIRQHPTQDVTVIHTVQQGGGFGDSSGHRFWHCVREGEELVCDVVCGVEISCPQRPGLIRANRSAAAQLGGASARVVKPTDEAQPDEAPVEDAPADHTVDDDDEAEEVDWSTRRPARPAAEDGDDNEEDPGDHESEEIQ